MINKRLSINIERKNLIIGSILILLGISAPIFINVYNFKVYDFYMKAWKRIIKDY